MNVAGQFTSFGAIRLPPAPNPERQSHVEALFNDYERQVFDRTNRFFTWLLPIQWAFAIALGVIVSPRTWSGLDSSVNPHLLAAIFLGGLLVAPPLWMMRTLPNSLATRQVLAAAQMCFSALLIDLTGGRIETHFHVFGSLAFLALYRDWRVLPTATAVVALDHLMRGIWFPESVYGVPYATVWRSGEHAAWVIFEDVVLVWACLVSRREMWEICLRHDQNEQLREGLEERVRERTRDLENEVRERARTAEDLRRSEERFRQLIANVPIGIVETTAAGEVRLANPHLRTMLALNGDGFTVSDGRIFPKADRARFWDKLRASGEVRGFEATLYRADGNPVAVVINGRLSARAGETEPICEGTVEDVTERRKAAAELDALHQQLVVASRQAGQADVATGVLHNVGNVLTSVNLIVHDVQDRLKATRLKLLTRIAELLHQNRERLPEFFATDPVAKSLPEFLGKLEVYLREENGRLTGDIQTLVGHFEHIREIIQTQQRSARLFGVTETLSAGQLVDDAVRLNHESFARHGVAIEKRTAAAAQVRADRHKVLQILVNLLKNAKDAVTAFRPEDRRIMIEVEPAGDRVQFTVRDNGVGISPENLSKIFRHGFTTKADGHGFGLHSCVLAAREMTGDLTVASEGEGKGAAFTLHLPAAEKKAIAA